MAKIDFNQLTENGRVHNLTGRDVGRRARESLNLDGFDESNETVDVLIPDHIFLVTPSFFIGMFAKSVLAAGDVETFFKKYRFTSPPQVTRQLRDAARRSLLSSEKGK